MLRGQGAQSTDLARTRGTCGSARPQQETKNPVVALLSGGVPATVLPFYFPFTWQRWFLGLCLGLIWGNAFEYAYHRWLLHRPRSAFGKGHLEHHANVGTPEEPEHVPLGKSPLHIFFLFATSVRAKDADC